MNHTFNPTLLKNYGTLIQESSFNQDFNTDQDLLSNIKSEMDSSSSFSQMKDTLMAGLFEESSAGSATESAILKSGISNILDRQKAMLLQESSTVMSSGEAMAFSVASFPMLVDLYADPMLSKVVTVYPYDKPKLTIPRIKWVATLVDELGNETDYEYPTVTKAIRLRSKEKELEQNSNVYKKLDLAKKDFEISKRNAKITNIKYEDKDGNEKTESIVAIFDAKGYFFIDDLVLEGRYYKLQGRMAFDNGQMTWSLIDITDPVLHAGAPSATDAAITPLTVNMKFRLHGNGNGKAVIKTRPEMSSIEIDCDTIESFEITHIEEFLQDWKALWNMDILSTLKDHVKEQMKLNKDVEIADALLGNVPNAKKFNLFREFKVLDHNGLDKTRPNNVMDIFKNIYPLFIDLVDQMRKRTKLEPKYIVCGTKAGSILKSMQQFETSLVGAEGQIGQVKGNPQINKFDIIISDAVEDDLIHLITKEEEFAKATILEVTYQPLYVIIETTDSKKRTFIKSRGWIGIVRSEGIATIQIKDFDAFFGVN